jgi:hypothetical protein
MQIRKNGCSEVSHQKAHTQTESNYKLIFLYMLKNIEIIKFKFLTRFECVLFDVKLHCTEKTINKILS